MSTTLTPGQDASNAIAQGTRAPGCASSIGRLGGAPGVWLFIVASPLPRLPSS